MEWYKFNINDLEEEEYKEFFELLNPKKRESIKRLKKTDDKKRSVCAEMLVKSVISKKCGINIEDIVIDTYENGKPFCKNVDVAFNISHSGEYAVCAFGEKAIGIDIQKIVPYNEKTAKKVCSREEFEAVEKSADKAAEFIKLWTKKEAALKMQGDISFCDIKTCTKGKRIETFRFSDYFVSICEK